MTKTVQQKFFCGIGLVERATRVASSLGLHQVGPLRELIFALFIFDDIGHLYNGDHFQGDTAHKLRGASQLTMNISVTLAYFVPSIRKQFPLIDPIAGTAWVSTNALYAYTSEGKDWVDNVDTLYAVAVIGNMQLSFQGINLRPVEALGLLSGLMGLKKSWDRL